MNFSFIIHYSKKVLHSFIINYNFSLTRHVDSYFIFSSFPILRSSININNFQSTFSSSNPTYKSLYKMTM